MQDLFIEFLPPWVETGLQPAFYDRESGTVLQQTARMYAKVNELVKAVNGMDKVIKEYVDYIDNYFKNLDVQEEVNNKLDDMAEGGELAEFIAQYANLPCVHAYATISDMTSSENLADGSYARAMSKTVAGTGDGFYYKIRETVEGDNPDGENLVTITGTTLVAEKIPDYALTALANQIDGELDNKVDYYEITNQTVSEVQGIFDVERPKIISFLNDYTFNTTMHLNANTKILLNNHTLTFNVPSVIEDYEHSHGFYNFYSDDAFTAYGGNGNISIIGGKIVGGNLSFCHASNISVESVEFLNCKNGHILEMCAIKNLNVESCTFAGIPYGSSGEYIQNDSATYSAFPWFDEESATYDGTVCQGINIKNCIFKAPSDSNYIFDAGVGTHIGVTGDANATKGINIINCKFLNPNTSSIQFWNANGLIIEGCEFTGVSNAEASVHIRLRCGVENASIKNCSFKGQVRGIEFASPHLDVKNVDIVNNTFEGYTATTDDPYSIITVWNPTLVNISGNQFRNFSQRCIELLKDSDTFDSSVKHETSIINNTFMPLNNINYGCIAPACGVAYINNNTFNCDNVTIGNTRLIGVGSNAESVYASGNIVPYSLYGSSKDIYDKAYDSVTGTGGFRHIYGSPKQLWSGNSTSASITKTEYIIPTNFNTMVLTIGTGSNTQVITLKDFVLNDYLSPRTWLFNVIGTDLTTSVASMVLDSSGNLTYSGNVALRNVKLINE